MPDQLLKWRDEFPALVNSVYLISHSLGAQPTKAQKSVERFFSEWRKHSIAAWDIWLEKVDSFGNLVADIINAPKNTVTVHQNVSTLISILISCLRPTAKRNKIIYTDLNFPTVHYNFLSATRAGLKLKILRSPDGIRIPTGQFIDAIDESTLAVVIDHAIFRSGFLQDVPTITKAAHKAGALSIVDAYQTVGTVPVDVKKMGCDFLVGGSVKWLCGGPGACYMYVKKGLITKLEPMITGWFSHKYPFRFDMESLNLREDNWRFIGGTPAVISLYQASPGLGIIRDLGAESIRKKSVAQTSYLIDELKKLPVRINTPLNPVERGGIVCVDFNGAEKLTHRLVKNRIFADYRPNCGIRISPHFYTAPNELDKILLEIKRAVT